MPENPTPPQGPAGGASAGEPPPGAWKPGQGKSLGPLRQSAAIPSPGRNRGGRTLWAGLAPACVIAGFLVSYLLASSIAGSDVSAAKHSFAHSTTTAAAALKPALAHGEDLLTSSGTYFAHNAIGSPAEFAAWAKWARILHNHPELESLSLLALVRAPELAEFKERVAGIPDRARLRFSKASRAALSSFKISPPGYRRSYHCLALAGVARTPALKPAAGIDYCAYNAVLLSTRDNTNTMYGTAHLDNINGLVVLTPIYRGDLAPRTDLGRRAAFVGWLREVLNPSGLVAGIRRAEPGLAIRLRRATPLSTAAFASGTVSRGGLSAETDLHNGWVLSTFAPAPATGIRAHDDAVTALLTGALLSILFGAVLYLMGFGRGPAPQRLTAPRKREELYDQLTRLPNRGLTLDRAERMLARAGRQSGLMVGALFVDIDWFKDVNDELGTEAGDQLLRIVGERLNTVIRTHDTVGRYGGDEFVVLVESAARGMRLDSLARRIIESLHKPIELEGCPSFSITASIGVAFGRYATPEDLLRDAHMALFAAKAAGKDRYTLFNANMRSVIEGRGVLEMDLNRALEERQFNLRYQPIFDLNTQGVVAVETLLRWQHPIKGEIAPDDFIPLAEESGLIVPIGRWVLEQACTDAAAWNIHGHTVAVAVKVSANQLNREGFATDVQRALQQSGLEPKLLILEIAETTVMIDATGAARRLADLRALGVRIAIDDFGSGYAYRADLERMPIDFLKVDRNSLASSDDENYRSWLLEAILVFGRDLALTVIAKEVESQEQLWALKEMGCSLAQGYFMGEPAPAATVEQLLGVSIPVPAPAPVAAARGARAAAVLTGDPAWPPLAPPAPSAAAAPVPAPPAAPTDQ